MNKRFLWLSFLAIFSSQIATAQFNIRLPQPTQTEVCFENACVTYQLKDGQLDPAMTTAKTGAVMAKLVAINKQNTEALREQKREIRELSEKISKVQDQRLQSIELALLARIDASAKNWELSETQKQEIKDAILIELNSGR